jgi:hypothetical protein
LQEEQITCDETSLSAPCFRTAKFLKLHVLIATGGGKFVPYRLIQATRWSVRKQ